MTETTTMTTSKAEGRVLLPSHLVPQRYSLVLEPDLEAFTFAGTVDIEFKVDAAKLEEHASEITLHAKELAFLSAEYRVCSSTAAAEGDAGGDAAAAAEAGAGAAAKSVKATEIHLNLKATTVKFIFPKAIPETAEKVILSIQYSGFLNNQMAGFYRSSYKDINGNSKMMASTQFESLDARRCFPCIDEPGVKAVFGVTLTIPSQLTCFSNMPESSHVSLPGGLKKKVQFLDTPFMSTYLLAFCVGEFDYVQAQGPNGVLVRVYTPPGKTDHGIFALKIAVQALQDYNEFFQLPYCLPKLDMVGIPEFAMGAMENWGLVTYREVDLLIDPVKASFQQKQRVAIVVTHELAHQWFGNLVTMQWWDDLWLNEGFAAWAEHWATDQQFPEYKMWEQFTTGHLAAGMRADSLRSSHPIQVPIKHAEEVEQVFDSISYCKGAAVVRMIRAVLGPKHFQAGLVNYMQKFAYGNTETFDLWKAWEDVSKIPVGEMMNSWTEQMGFPLLRVMKEDWQDDNVTLELDQLWFLSDGSTLTDEEAAKKWTIPILTCTAEGTQADMTLMREKTATVTIPITGGGWVKLNAGQEVPIRVLMGPEMLKRLAVGIQDKTISPIDRAGILNDAFSLVKAGHMPPESLIRLLVNYKDEDNYIVWEGLSSVLNGLDSLLSNDETLGAFFQNFAKDFCIKLMAKVGWDSNETDGHLTTLLRNIMVNLLSTFSYYDPDIAKEAKSRFVALQQDPEDVKALPTDLRTPVFKIYLKNGGSKEYDEVLDYFRKATSDADRKHAMSSIGHTPDPKLKKAVLEWALSGEVKTQDIISPFGSVGHSSKGGSELCWEFYQNNLHRIEEIMGSTSAILKSHMIVMCAGGFCTHEKADEIEAFFEKNPMPSCSRKISQLLENMRANAKLLDNMKASELAKAEFWDTL